MLRPQIWWQLLRIADQTGMEGPLIMKPMSKAELALEKRISRLEGQLAAAKYALNLMRNGSAEIYVHGTIRRITSFNGDSVVSKCSKRIPLFS